MNLWFRRLGQSEYVDVFAEDRTQSADHPRTFLLAKKTFKKLDGLLDAAEQVGVSEQGLMDLNAFAQQHLRSIQGSSGDLPISKEELLRMGFPPLERAMRIYLVSVVPEASSVDHITVRAKMQDPPPGARPKIHERSFSRAELDDTLALIERTVSDLFNPQLGRDVPKKARFDAEDAHTLFRW